MFVEARHDNHTAVADLSAPDMRDRLNTLARLLLLILADPRTDSEELVTNGNAAATIAGGEIENFLL